MTGNHSTKRGFCQCWFTNWGCWGSIWAFLALLSFICVNLNPPRGKEIVGGQSLCHEGASCRVLHHANGENGPFDSRRTDGGGLGLCGKLTAKHGSGERLALPTPGRDVFRTSPNSFHGGWLIFQLTFESSLFSRSTPFVRGVHRRVKRMAVDNSQVHRFAGAQVYRCLLKRILLRETLVNLCTCARVNLLISFECLL